MLKIFLDNIHVVNKTTLTVEKRPLVLILPCIDSISLQTRTKLKIVNCCKLQIVFKNRQQLSFQEIGFPKILLVVPFINFSVNSAMSPIIVNV